MQPHVSLPIYRSPGKVRWIFLLFTTLLMGEVIPVYSQELDTEQISEGTTTQGHLDILKELIENIKTNSTDEFKVQSLQNVTEILSSVLGNVLAKVENGGIDIFHKNNVAANIMGQITSLFGDFQGNPNEGDKQDDTGTSVVGNFLKTAMEGVKAGKGITEMKPVFFNFLLDQMPDAEEMQDTISDTLGMHRNFGKALAEIVGAIKEVNGQGKTKGKYEYKDILKNKFKKKYYSKKELMDNSGTEDSDETEGSEDIADLNEANRKFMELVKEIFTEEFGTLDFFQQKSGNASVILGEEYKPGNITGSGVWMMVKSTWQRILAYVKRENSLRAFMEMTPVKIIDRILSLGDNVNLMGFLATKLDPDFAAFLTEEVSPYLGPLRDFDSFYNFMTDYGLKDLIDYIKSAKVGYTINTMTRLMSAYLQDTVSDDLVNEYIEFISFNNTELSTLYKSIVASKKDNASEEDNNGYHRFQKQAVQDIANAFKHYEDNSFGYRSKDAEEEQEGRVKRQAAEDTATAYQYYGDYLTGAQTDEAAEGLMGNTSDYFTSEQAGRSGYGGGAYIYDKSSGYGGGGGHGGGYGGGGYGGGMMTDPYVALGALALGTLLGFLLFRLINGTRRRGRRDINDGSLSLWLSDIPDKFFFWNNNENEIKQDSTNRNNTNENFNLPASLRGDVWSSDPLVGDEFFNVDYEEDDIADQLNHLWRVYKNSSSPACVHSHFCNALTNSTAEDLTGRDSSMALLMASVSNLMGVVRSGQLVDHVTQTLVLGEPYSCSPSLPTCQQLL